jgi:hypothetical protein
MREILADIFTWPWFSQPHGYNFNGHFIRHPDGVLIMFFPLALFLLERRVQSQN